jgi:hypothetical protein
MLVSVTKDLPAGILPLPLQQFPTGLHLDSEGPHGQEARWLFHHPHAISRVDGGTTSRDAMLGACPSARPL